MKEQNDNAEVSSGLNALGKEYTASAKEILTETLSLLSCFTKGIKRSFCFSGRARRREYWGFQLFHFILLFFCVLVSALINLDSVRYVTVIIAFAVWLLPSTAVTVRRLHDINISGWHVLPLVYIQLSFMGGDFCGYSPLFYSGWYAMPAFMVQSFFNWEDITVARAGADPIWWIKLWIDVILWIALGLLMIIWCCRNSKPDNRYGKCPKD